MGYKFNEEIGGIPVTYANIHSYTVDIKNKRLLVNLAYFTSKGASNSITLKKVSLRNLEPVSVEKIYSELNLIPPYSDYEKEED